MGVCMKGRTKSRYNPQNIIIVMFVIESVLEAGLFHGDEICMITPYREQVTRIREAIIKAGANKNLRDRGILEVRVNTIDSMQGGEANMVIVDFVLAKRRKGRHGFLTNRGRINVSITRPGSSRYSLVTAMPSNHQKSPDEPSSMFEDDDKQRSMFDDDKGQSCASQSSTSKRSSINELHIYIYIIDTVTMLSASTNIHMSNHTSTHQHYLKLENKVSP